MQNNRFKIARNQHRSMKLNRGCCFASWMLIKDNFRKLDKFGHPISLTYKGRDKYQTAWGACLSMLVCLIMTWVVLIMVSQILTQPFQRREVVKELIDPGLSIQGEPTKNSTLLFDNHENLFTFVNMDSFTDQELTVSYL